MSFSRTIGNFFQMENVESIDGMRVSFAAPWAQSAPAWVLFGCVLLMVASVWFYRTYQSGPRPKARMTLAVVRGLLLSCLFVILADPVLRIAMTNQPRPLLYVLLDGTDSMAIEEHPTDEYRARLNESLDLKLEDSSKISRVDTVRKWVGTEDKNALAKLNEKFRLRLFSLDRRNGVRTLRSSEEGENTFDPEYVAEQLTTTGQVTALGNGIHDLSQRHTGGRLAGMVIVSDFVTNGGRAVIGSDDAPARKFGRPIYTVGVGIEEPAELVVDCRARPFMKNEENYTVQVALKQNGLKDKTATVRLYGIRLDESGEDEGERELLGAKEVSLSATTNVADFPYKARETGRYRLVAEVDRFEEEAESEDEVHRSERDVEVGDNFVRLMYVAYEPTWEWRFIKEVFHRDPRVGTKGFRTYLHSSDPNVRRTNELFATTLTPPRRDFFANDVVFLGDMPNKLLNNRFCDHVHEFVTQFGGGLVVLAGPRFGPSQLAGTAIEEILPVDLDPEARVNDSREFRLRLTEEGSFNPFMRLGGQDPDENLKAWNNLGRLPWYQPVLKPKQMATVLAEHPSDYCIDGKHRQPLIAVREFASGGKVVYVGFNEMWRLRRKYGERYYGQFWGQLFNELGFRRRSGYQKRFVVKTDRPDGKQYRTDDKVIVTVDAYDENFESLTHDKLPEGKLKAELTVPGTNGEPPSTKTVFIPYTRDGIYETRIPVFQEGEYRLSVEDPIKNQLTEPRVFRVVSESAERTNAQRDFQLERELKQETGGENFDITNAWDLADHISLPEIKETTVRVVPLWNTWLCFIVVLGLMLSEWLGRKWIHLP